MELTNAQRLATMTFDRSTAILAGAGSGKTSVLVERIARLLAQGSVKLDQLCCITFTEKAAAELKARLTTTLGPTWYLPLSQAQLSTFHALEARILREQAAVVGIDATFTILDETAANLLLARAARATLLEHLEADDADVAQLLDQTAFGPLLQAIETLVDQRWAMHQLPATPNLPPPTAEEATTITALHHLAATVEERYTQAKRVASQLDFHDLEIETLQLLRGNATICQRYQELFRAILVDEAQDVNDVQAELLRLLYVPGRNTLMIVGDPKQSIYRFRGANVAAFQQLMQEITASSGHQIILQENFRSRPAICAFVNRVSANIHDYQPLLPTRPDDTTPHVIALHVIAANGAALSDRRDAEAEAIAAFISERHAAGNHWKAHALLFQSKSDMDRYAATLRSRAIPTFCHRGGGFLDRPEVLDILAALKTIHGIVHGVPYNTALLRLLRSPLFGLTDDACYRLCFPDLVHPTLPPRALHAAALADPLIGQRLRQWAALAERTNVGALMQAIVESTGYDVYCLATEPSGQSLANLEKLFWIAEREGADHGDFLDHLEELRGRAARIPDQPVTARTEDLVQLMTVHAAKGLEFDTVILPDLMRHVRPDAGRWLFLPGHGIGCKLADPADPFAPAEPTERWTALHEIEKAAHTAEQQRLLYVALTRARDTLVLPIHCDLTRDAGTWHETLKAFLSEGCEERIAAPAGRTNDVIANAAKQSPIDIREIATAPFDTLRGPRNDNVLLYSRTLFTVSELDTYAKCPMQYRLQYVERIPATSLTVSAQPARPIKLPGHVLGDVVHATIRTLTTSPHREPSAELSLAFRRLGHRPSAADMAHAQRLIATYRAQSVRHPYTQQFAEWPFLLQFGPVRIRGMIDHVGKSTSGWTITDYKTDRIDTADDIPRLTEEYELPMMIYTLAAQQGLGTPLHSTRLHFLEVDEMVEHAVTTARIATATRCIENIIENLQRESFAIGNGMERPCARCPYHHNHTCWEDDLARVTKSSRETRD